MTAIMANCDYQGTLVRTIFLFCILGAMIASAPAGAKDYPFVGTWDCEVATFTYTSESWNNGVATFPFSSVNCCKGDEAQLMFRGGYETQLSQITPDSMKWYSPASGDGFDCKRIGMQETQTPGSEISSVFDPGGTGSMAIKSTQKPSVDKGWAASLNKESIDRVIADARSQCAAVNDGVLSYSNRLITNIDISGDGNIDHIIDHSQFNCSSAIVFWRNGLFDITTIVNTRSVDIRNVARFTITDWDGQKVLLVDRHHSACPAAVGEPCVQAYTWSDYYSRVVTVTDKAHLQ